MGSYIRVLEWADALLRLRTNNPDSGSVRTYKKVGIRIRNEKQKIVSRMMSSIRRKQIAAAEERAASVYERTMKEVDSSPVSSTRGLAEGLAKKLIELKNHFEGHET